VLFACLVLPWLNPRAGGPSASVEPWLFSMACGAVAYALHGAAVLRPALLWSLAALASWGLSRSGVSPESVGMAAACLVVYLAASVAASAHGRLDAPGIVAMAWLAAAIVSTAFALLQYFGIADVFGGWISAASTGEAFANLRQRNQFASLTVIGMAALFWLRPSGVRHLPALAAMCWLAIGNAATTSRTGLLQMIVLGVIACLWPGPRRERAVLWTMGLLAYLLAALALPLLLEHLVGVTGNRLWERVAAVDSCSSRKVLWSNVLHLIAQKPWLGWGWGELDYAHFMTLYEGPRFCDILDNAHNLPLHLAVELGLPAALLVCAGLMWLVLRARPWREEDPGRQMAWAVLVVIGLHSLVEYPLWYGPFQIALGLALGLLCASPGAAHLPPVTGLARQRILAATVLVTCTYAAWDYWRVSQIYLPVGARADKYRNDPLPEIRKSWLFRSQARFAELTITPLTPANASDSFDSAARLLHYSPEPRVIEKLVESGVALGRADEMLPYLARFRAAFPEAYDAWTRSNRGQQAIPQ
jgi:O-antigen ligase